MASVKILLIISIKIKIEVLNMKYLIIVKELMIINLLSHKKKRSIQLLNK
jgi:hypothetical protein